MSGVFVCNEIREEVSGLNIFDAVKDELNARQVVEAYGIQVRHNGMCCCPFHGDKNPSMKVDNKRFHCFGCGEKEHHFYKEISDYYHRVKEWKEAYKPKSMDEEWDDHFVEALNYILMLEGIMDAFLAADRSSREEMFRTYAKTESFCAQRNLEAKEMKEAKSVSVLNKLQQMPKPPSKADKSQKAMSHHQGAIAI